MGEQIDTEELKEKLEFSGLNRILYMSLREERDERGVARRETISEDITKINLELSVDSPSIGWRKAIGKFYEDKGDYDEQKEWRMDRLRELFGEDPLSYFMGYKPDFRLSEWDGLIILKSVVTVINRITDSGIPIHNIANNLYNPMFMVEAAEITKKVPYERYVIGENHRILV